MTLGSILDSEQNFDSGVGSHNLFQLLLEFYEIMEISNYRAVEPEFQNYKTVEPKPQNYRIGTVQT